MDTGSYKKYRDIILITVLCLCVAFGAAAGVNAYLTAVTQPLPNTFVPAEVSCQVEENFQDGVKSDVKIRNTGNIDAYIRAVVVANFVSEDGNVLATMPKEDVDYTISWGNAGWRKGTDGYWYYEEPVAPDETTAALIDTATGISAPSGYHLHIQIIATAVQSAPDSAVQEAWGVGVTDGKLVPN